MKILFNISGLSSGGAERVISLLANYGIQNGHEIGIMIAGGPVCYNIDSQIPIFRVGKNLTRPFTSFYYYFKMRKAIRQYQPDIIVSFLTIPNIYVIWASLGLNIPIIVSERNAPIQDLKNSIKRFIRNISYRKCSGIIFQTEDARLNYPDIIQRKSIIIPNPLKENLPYAKPKDHNYIVAIGRLAPQKNYPLLITAFAKFKKINPEYELRIYGAGDSLKYKLQIDELNLSDSIKFMGTSQHIHEEITDASMYVLSSDYEGMSNSLMEALAMGLPCISTDCPAGGSRYLIRNGENGLLIPVNDIDSLYNAMCSINDDFKNALNMGKKGIIIRENHNKSIICKRYYDYMGLIYNKAK